MQPETLYARCGNLHIAYQVVGEGPPDLVFVPGVAIKVQTFFLFELIQYFLMLVCATNSSEGSQRMVPSLTDFAPMFFSPFLWTHRTTRFSFCLQNRRGH